MPDPGPLDALRARLRADLDPRQIFHAPVWGNPRAMSEALRAVRRDLGESEDDAPAKDVLQLSLRSFVDTKNVTNFTELKYVCYGVTVPIGDAGPRVIDRTPLFKKLLDLVQARETQPKQFRRCYQGLLSSYFGFDRADGAETARRNWESLREFLDDRLRPIRSSSERRGVVPEWLGHLDYHKNLLSEDPCSRYALGFVRGKTDELNAACAGLGIPSTSWVWDEALRAYVDKVCSYVDATFMNALPNLLAVLDGSSELRASDSVLLRATATTVIRYSKCEDRAEHPALRDVSLQRIGNPWLKKTAWDAHVKNESARQMVEGWLKRRLIKDFFELLAQDGGADLRRLNYWLKWEPQITDMWFVLGGDALRNPSAPFVDLRKRMAGRDRVLSGTNTDLNNAFVMRIGPLIVIEFGLTGNACFVMPASDFRANLEKKSFTIFDLKQRAGARRLFHRSTWEWGFDQEMRDMLRTVPTSKGVLTATQAAVQPPNDVVSLRPSATQPGQSPGPLGKSLSAKDFDTLRALCVRHGVEWEDNRAKKGALWILIPDRNRRPGVSAILDRHGFQFAEGKGFWLKDHG